MFILYLIIYLVFLQKYLDKPKSPIDDTKTHSDPNKIENDLINTPKDPNQVELDLIQNDQTIN